MALDPKRNYHTVILEVRPKQQSVHAFITLLDKTKQTDICLEDQDIYVVNPHSISRIRCYMNIVRDSLSLLKIVDNYITFKFLTNNTPSSLKTLILKFFLII
ncbi:hypothetical protein NQ314_010620 [Rhamnusium bicolor]|uniref:Uncharacterized protein n=1 Tax=Rhamnusium bicolor TaxID=1586634 RepID=A0AAV8XP47_9CUCU|nr:hypothetical protein NQ314_010620 [Rhamnusium bicolor]